MADLPRCDLQTDEAHHHHHQMMTTMRRVPQLHPDDDKHQQGGPCTLLEERVDSGVDSGMGFSLGSSVQDSHDSQFSPLSLERVQEFLSSDSGRACLSHSNSRQLGLEVDNRPVSYRSDSISTSLQNQLRNLSLSEDNDHHHHHQHHHDHLNNDSSSSLGCSSVGGRCDSGICDSGICVSAGSCYSSVGDCGTGYPEAGFPECGLTSSAGQFDSNFSHQELLELFSQDEDGDTYLHMSIIHLLPEVALKVIAVAPHPDCLNIPNRLQQTPLHLAVATHQLLVARRLMVAGSNLESPDHQGNTPLHMACREGLVDMVDLLLTPVHYRQSLANTQYSSPDLPLTSRVPQDLALRNYEGYTCAHLALQGGHLEVLQHLLNKGANINEPDGKSGRTLLHMAADLGYLPALQLLLAQRGLQLDARTYGGLTAVTLAHGRQLNQVVDLLTRAGADLSQIVALDRLRNNESSAESSSDEEMNDGVYDDICINGQPIHIS